MAILIFNKNKKGECQAICLFFRIHCLFLDVISPFITLSEASVDFAGNLEESDYFC